MKVKGTKDFLPQEMILRQQVIERVKNVFERFGFQPIETPTIENWEVLSAKGAGGEEILNETYNFEDKGGRKIGLRYDLTVPLARLIAENPNLPLPFKRYQIEKVWRYGDIAKGRLREFLQADIDIVGAEKPIADAEVIACAIECFNALGFKNFLVRLNNRKILAEILRLSNIKKEKVTDVLRSIDKLEKIGINEVKKELEEKCISKESIKKILEFIELKDENILEKLEKLGVKEGIDELKEIIYYLKLWKLDSKVRIDLSLARGLDYYTGPIFEIFVEEGIGSLAGGGRYDNLIGLFLKKDISATGISLGIERIMEVIKERKMINEVKNKTKIFVVAVNDKVREKVLEIVKMLREKIAVDYDLRFRTLSKQLDYANAIGIPFTILVGENELRENSVKIRDMKTGNEEIVGVNEILNYLNAR
ncbi:MAG: histidine--tRNA ligase [Candidatus Aenigmatarchaeota archaeon]